MNPDRSKWGTPRAIVIGAGVVGTATAAHLLQRGFEVTLLDRDRPGSGCSSGNAGMLGTASCVPSALPGVLHKVPRMLASDGPLSINWRILPRLVPWLCRFVASARESRVREIADAMHTIQSRLLEPHLELARWAGAENLIGAPGKLQLYQTPAAYEADRYGRQLMQARGIDFEELSEEAARARVPTLAGVYRALWFPSIRHVRDPEAMVRAWSEALQREGGKVVGAEVTGIRGQGERGIVVRTTAGEMAADLCVVAAGCWSADLLRPTGLRIPLIAQRGYHVMLSDGALRLPHPVKVEDRKIILTPMRGGIRVTGIAELTDTTAPPDHSKALRLHRAARETLTAVPDEPLSWWSGLRPSTPDSLPVIGRHPSMKNLILAFGHGHWGFGLGAITGRLVARLAAGETPGFPLAPYRPTRF